jgi:diguanylate cyclase (GGDEF)-like protein
LLYIDLDHFKGINDSYGYSYGDAILIAVSKRIKEGLKDVNATVVRLSADEFILLIENTDRAQIEAYCHTLLAYINIPYIINNTDFKISASIGIAQSPKDAAAMETLISYANNSMLIAKKTKNNFIFFSERIHQQLIKNIEIEQALQNALSKNEISLVYQPQLNNQGQLYGVEALVRWNNEKLGFIPPGQFIPIAEETGLMPELGAYIMNKAMHEISTLQYKKEKAFQLSINVSARQFAQLNFFEALIECLACYKSPYLEITIEITESLFIENIERLLPIFQKMKDENISLSLDDFGTGYSSLSMLRNVPIDELKIDKSFVDHIADNKNDCAMVSSIITMGKNLGMTVLAEGIENKKQATILQGAGCDLYQGYYFSKPLNLTDLEKYIDTL